MNFNHRTFMNMKLIGTTLHANDYCRTGQFELKTEELRNFWVILM